jgi:hypothetical protein
VQLWFVALLVLSAAGVIEARCATPALRPEAPAADRAFRILGRSAFAFWLVLLGWGFLFLPWWQPLGGILGSLALNAMIVRGGPRPYFPGLAMGLALVGLFLAAVVLARS